MELHTPRHDTTVGRVEIPPFMFNAAQHRSLAGTLTGARVAQANSARRRLNGPTLLGSPARRGHSPKMADIFGTARSSIANKTAPAIRVTPPSLISSPPSLHLRPARTLNQSFTFPATPNETDNGVPLYPVLPPEEGKSVTKLERNTPLPIQGIENARQTYQQARFCTQFWTEHSQHQEHRLSPAPDSRAHSFFNKPPQVAQAQIVAMNEIETMHLQEDLSSSSASWTGDSQFYIPQHKALVLPHQERKSSVPEWLERLPAKPDEFETDDHEKNEKIVPLSPHVETERGSMREKMRKRDKLKRCSSYGDEAVFTEKQARN